MARPTVPWVESDGLEAHLAAAGATPAQAQAARDLAARGFSVLTFADPEIPSLCEQAVAELRPFYTDPAVNRIQDAWRASPAVRALATAPEVVDFLRLAYGREPFPFQTLNFERGSEQHAHADTIHFHCVPPLFMCGVWFALEDVAEDAGPLVYYPGSHRLPVLSMQDVGALEPATSEDPYGPYTRHYEPAIDRVVADHAFKPAHALLKKGQALVWAANLIHGGEAIRRPGATRRSLVAHYYFEGCLYLTPLSSDMERRRYALRVPTDVRSGLLRWPNRDGRPAWPGLRRILGELRQWVQGRPIVYRDGG